MKSSFALLVALLGSANAGYNPKDDYLPTSDCQCNSGLLCRQADACKCRFDFESGDIDRKTCRCAPLGLFYQLCTNGEICCTQDRRQLKGSDTFFNGDEPEYQAHIEKCGEFDYDALLFVDDHLHGVISPKEEAVEAGCPFLVVHSRFEGPSHGPARKEILFFEDKESGETLFANGGLSQGSVQMGTFTLEQLARAYDEVDASEDESYDIVKNNCGNFMVNLASKLDIKVNAEVTSFVARRLLQESGKQFVESIRNNVNLSFLFQGDRRLRGDIATDEELVEALVDSHMEGLQH